MRTSLLTLVLAAGLSLMPMMALADAEKPANLIAGGIPAVPDRIGIGVSHCRRSPSHTTGHAGPHPAVRALEVMIGEV